MELYLRSVEFIFLLLPMTTVDVYHMERAKAYIEVHFMIFSGSGCAGQGHRKLGQSRGQI